MIVRFTAPDGRAAEVEGAPGERLLDVAWRAGQPLEGTCNGLLACATCHVIFDPANLALLPPPGAEEEDMLDLVPGATRGSRLSCQVALPAGCDRLNVSLPAG